jgi:hypothetical protein
MYFYPGTRKLEVVVETSDVYNLADFNDNTRVSPRSRYATMCGIAW